MFVPNNEYQKALQQIVPPSLWEVLQLGELWERASKTVPFPLFIQGKLSPAQIVIQERLQKEPDFRGTYAEILGSLTLCLQEAEWYLAEEKCNPAWARLTSAALLRETLHVLEQALMARRGYAPSEVLQGLDKTAWGLVQRLPPNYTYHSPLLERAYYRVEAWQGHLAQVRNLCPKTF